MSPSSIAILTKIKDNAFKMKHCYDLIPPSTTSVTNICCDYSIGYKGITGITCKAELMQCPFVKQAIKESRQ
jgi:hypothetical protein